MPSGWCAEGRAYRCRCTPETLDALRREAQQRGDTFRYPGTCRDADVPASESARAAPADAATGQTVVDDVIHGRVVFEHAMLDDWILVSGATARPRTTSASSWTT